MHRLLLRFVLLAGLAGLGSIAWGQCSVNCCYPACPERRTISVNGSAQVTADADLAVVRVGYRLYGPDAKSAYASALDTSNAVMQALTGSGIPKSAIESSSQVLQRTQPYELQQFPMNNNNDERTRRQFTVTQSWTIRVKPDDASSALNAAINAGANESGWIQWIVNDPSALEARAAAQAVANARTIAEQIAQKSGVHLGNLTSVNENQGPSMYNGVMAMDSISFGMGTAEMFNVGGPVGNQQLAINSRRVEFRTTVYAVFAIEEAGTPSK
jgi:uncharacterized protein